jgi:hypothetical protein
MGIHIGFCTEAILTIKVRIERDLNWYTLNYGIALSYGQRQFLTKEVSSMHWRVEFLG